MQQLRPPIQRQLEFIDQTTQPDATQCVGHALGIEREGNTNKVEAIHVRRLVGSFANALQQGFFEAAGGFGATAARWCPGCQLAIAGRRAA